MENLGLLFDFGLPLLILIIAYLIPAIAISWKITGNPVPQIGFGSTIAEGQNAGVFLLETLDALHRDLGEK